MKNINLVLEYLYQRNLYSKLEKYELHKEEVDFLGLIIRLKRT